MRTVSRYIQVLAIVVGVLALTVNTASAQDSSEAPTIYRLNPGSSFQQGCFPPCLCPVLERAAVRGTLLLTPTGFDSGFNTFAVTDVNWTVSLGESELRILGSGTYKVGGGWFAGQRQLVLDLRVGNSPVQQFDSGLVPAGGQFPDISVTISIHGQVCFDTVFLVDASPVPTDQIHPYALLPESVFQRGCFPPCLCPLQVPRPISGRFALVDLGQGPLFTEFAVINVDWLVAESGWWPALPVRGVGTYRVGGEFAAQQQLSLDLTVDDEDRAHFDSGLVLGGGDFPFISSRVSIEGMRCFDTVIDVSAVPVDDVTRALPPGAHVASTWSASDDVRHERPAPARSRSVIAQWPWRPWERVGYCR